MASYNVILLMACIMLAFSRGAVSARDPVPVAKALALKAIDATQDVLNVAAAEKAERCIEESEEAVASLDDALKLLAGPIDRAVASEIVTDGYDAQDHVKRCSETPRVREAGGKALKAILAFISIANNLPGVV